MSDKHPVRADCFCIHCGEEYWNPVTEVRLGQEFHVASRCDECGELTWFLFNLVFYNSVTVKEYEADPQDLNVGVY